MDNDASKSANAIIAAALEKAGVAPRNVELPAEAKPAGDTSKEGKPNLDGTLKGAVMGEDAEPEDSSSEAKSETTTAKAEPAKAEQPLGKADIAAAIDQASSRFQSLLDRKVYQLQQQMTQTITALNQFFQNQENTSLEHLPPEEQVLKRIERLEKGTGKPRIQIEQPIESQATQFYQQLANFVDAVGLKVDDKRIDWAPDISDPKAGFNRFLVSIKAALTEDQTKAIQELKKNGDKELQNIRKKTGVDKVSTSGPSGAGLPNVSKMTPFQKLEYGFQQNELLAQTGQK